MKVCPACSTTYDDSQNFCLNDGTPLLVAENEPETVVVPPNQYASRSGVQSGYQAQPPVARPNAPQTKSNTGLIVGLTALVAILLLGVGFGGWWVLSRRNNSEVARANVNINANANARTKPSPATNSNANSNTNSNVAVNNQNVNAAVTTDKPAENANAAGAAETAPPPPPQQPPVSAAELSKARRDAAGVLNSWIAALNSGNLNSHISYYADSVDYYQGRYSRSQVLADKQRAFQDFDELEMDVSNVRTNVDPSGNKAVITYDKEWNFQGAEKNSEGKVQSQLTLERFGGRWLITGERDLRVYYQRSY